MVDVADAIGLVVILAVNSTAAALLTRFFRARLETDWGPVVYILFFGPVGLFALTLVLGGVLGLGPDLGTPAMVLAATVVLPLSLGVTFDYFWMPAPEEVDLPDTDRATR